MIRDTIDEKTYQQAHIKISKAVVDSSINQYILNVMLQRTYVGTYETLEYHLRKRLKHEM